MKEQESNLSKVFKWILKTIWKLFLILLWGILRLSEVICGQFASWLKRIIS